MHGPAQELSSLRAELNGVLAVAVLLVEMEGPAEVFPVVFRNEEFVVIALSEDGVASK